MRQIVEKTVNLGALSNDKNAICSRCILNESYNRNFICEMVNASLYR